MSTSPTEPGQSMKKASRKLRIVSKLPGRISIDNKKASQSVKTARLGFN